jgi:predicted NBD/HSP70 family sugar kinase
VSQAKVRKENRRKLLRALVEHGPTPRAVLAGHLDVTPAAVSRLVREMISAGILEEGERFSARGRPGRQFVRVGFAAETLFVIGVGLEAFSQVVVVANLNGGIVAARTLGLTAFGDTAAVFDRIAEALAAMLHEIGVASTRVIGMGVAVVGIVDRSEGRVVRSAHLGWSEVPIAAELRSRTGIPVVVENLLHSTNLAEHAFGVSKGFGDVLLVRASLSIGASLIIDGSLARGSLANAGQIAHAPTAGRQQHCYCGAVGCLETEASGRAIVARAEGRHFVDLATDELGSLSKRLSDLLARADAGEAAANGHLRASGRALGRALEWPVATLDPGCIVLSGPVGRNRSYVAGVGEGLASHHAQLRTADRALVVSMMAIRETALRLAITEFLMTRDVDVARLMAAADSPAADRESAPLPA